MTSETQELQTGERRSSPRFPRELWDEMEFCSAWFGIGVPERLLGLLALRRYLERTETLSEPGSVEEVIRETLALRPKSHELIQLHVGEIDPKYHAAFVGAVLGYAKVRGLTREDLLHCLNELQQENRLLLRPKAYELLATLRAGTSDPKLEREYRLKEHWDRVLAEPSEGPAEPPQAASSEAREFFSRTCPELDGIVPPGQSSIEFYALYQQKQLFDCIVARTFGRNGPFRISSKVFFATVAQPEPYARILSIESSDQRLIVLSRGLWLATGVASLLLALSTLPDKGLLPEHVAFDPSTETRTLLSTLRELLAGVRADATYLPVDDPEQIMFWDSVDAAMKGFVLGHEYAHFQCRHTHSPAAASGAAPRMLDSWEQEYEADLQAFHLTHAYTRQEVTRRILKLTGRSPEEPRNESAVSTLVSIYAGMGACLVLDLIQAIEDARGVFAQPEDTHPPTLLRMRRIVRALNGLPNAREVRDRVEVGRRALHLLLDWGFTERRSHLSRFQEVALGSLWCITHDGLERRLRGMAACLRSAAQYETASEPPGLDEELWNALRQASIVCGPEFVAAQCERCAAIVRRDAEMEPRFRPS